MQLLSVYTSSALLVLLSKADSFLIPCPFKYITHLDCPGCGFQRSILALIQGNFENSFHLYPPTVPFLLSLLIGALSYIFKWDKNAKSLKSVYLVTGFIILINYSYKIITQQLY